MSRPLTNQLTKRLIITALLITAANLAASLARDSQSADIRILSLDTPPELRDWKLREITYNEPPIQSDGFIHRVYESPTDGFVEILVLYHKPRRYSHYTPETCLGNAGWEVMSSRRTMIETVGDDGERLRVPVTEAALMHGRDERGVVVFWTRNGDMYLTGRLQERFAMIGDFFRRNPESTIMTRVWVVSSQSGDRQFAFARKISGQVVRLLKAPTNANH